MNCKQVEDLLPLYVSHDLADKQARSVTDHLQNCAACAVVLREHREAQQLLRDFASPAFDAAAYDAIRQNVWRRIETESAKPAVTEIIAGWFGPRLAWAAAAMVLMAIAIGGIYLLVRRQPDRRETVARETVVNTPSPKVNPPVKQEGSDGARVAVSGKEKRSRQPQARPTVPKRGHDTVPDSRETLVATAPDASRSTGATVNAGQGKTVRMEIQTSDPNIRIIWFAQPN